LPGAAKDGDTASVRIETFQFHDRTTGWELEETKFDAFNLLVGVSGVGKTKILKALEQVRQFALGDNREWLDASWSLEFEHDEHRYHWQASVRSRPGPDAPEQTEVQSETLVKDAVRLVHRTAEAFSFNSVVLPKLPRVLSAIVLLAAEDSIAPINVGLGRMLFSNPDNKLAFINVEDLDTLTRAYGSSDALRADVNIGVIPKAYALQTIAPDEWKCVVDLFVSIFPSVADVKVIKLSDPEYPYQRRSTVAHSLDYEGLCLAIREKETGTWVAAVWISSGMHRTLAHLIEISLAPPGTVVLIDEFENSLGKNCMPQLVDFILSRAPDLQFIITSHHPYIINNLPISTWKLVQRRGSRVKVLNALDIPGLKRASHHDAFDRLLNLPEFEDGIA
jgi:hypothetical protein